MDIQETLDLVVTKQAEFNEKNDAAVTAITDEVQAIKSQVTELAETKSALASTQETITALQDQIEQLQDAQAKGIHSMSTTTNTPEVKFADICEAYKSGLVNGQLGEIKTVFASTNDTLAPLYVQGWEAEIIKPMKDFSPILSVVGIRDVDSTRGLRKRVQVAKTGSRVGHENAANAMLTDTGAAQFEWYSAGFTCIESFQIVTKEAKREGDFDMVGLAADVQETLAVAAARNALFGCEKMPGLFAYFGDNKADADRAYDKYQALDVVKGFGTDYSVSLKQLQAVKRALAMAYRTGAVWYMNEETYDTLGSLTDGANRPLIKDILTEGFDGQLLGFPVVIDPTMPGLGDAGKIAVMFGDMKRAVQFFRINGEHKVDELAIFRGNTHIYDSVEFGMRMEHSFALKGLRVAAK
ncbi:HK97 family phage major capsid protein [Aeromonas hydrophila]|uniref:phage major capsid protein n=1 Tax=Aeromonas hydrophila TaxID=644 RepID=UPI0021679BC4|nr:phage major capsid protein [Aeromonas hydrophila]MCS3766166.1 HK97 family phage major capsid protein [Aeromonas hydrophila]